MTFKPRVWYPIAVALCVLNLVGAGFAIGEADPWHAIAHVALATAFGAWARRLRRPPDVADDESRLEALDADVNALRDELSEAQERLDFAERMLAQRPKTPERTE